MKVIEDKLFTLSDALEQESVLTGQLAAAALAIGDAMIYSGSNPKSYAEGLSQLNELLMAQKGRLYTISADLIHKKDE